MAEVAARPRRTALVSAVAVGIVLAVLIAVLATRKPADERLGSSPLVGKPVPSVSGTSVLDGTGFDIASQSGRFVLVNFFATWCTPCQREHGDLLRFNEAHKAAGDLRVVSVVFNDKPLAVKQWFADRGGDWPVVNDGDGRIATDFGVTGVPESYLVGPEGVVRAKLVGGVQYDSLQRLLAKAEAR